MIFNIFLATTFPLMMGVYWYSILGGKRDFISIIGVFSTLAVFVHGILYFIALQFRSLERWSFSDDAMFTLKYLFASAFLSVIFAHIIRFIEMNMAYKLKVERNDD